MRRRSRRCVAKSRAHPVEAGPHAPQVDVLDQRQGSVIAGIGPNLLIVCMDRRWGDGLPVISTAAAVRESFFGEIPSCGGSLTVFSDCARLSHYPHLAKRGSSSIRLADAH